MISSYYSIFGEHIQHNKQSTQTHNPYTTYGTLKINLPSTSIIIDILDQDQKIGLKSVVIYDLH